MSLQRLKEQSQADDLGSNPEQHSALPASGNAADLADGAKAKLDAAGSQEKGSDGQVQDDGLFAPSSF